MKRRINPFSGGLGEKLEFYAHAFNVTQNARLEWLAKHGHPEPFDEGFNYLAGEALELLYERTNGSVDLITPELIDEVHADIEPDPDFYPSRGR